MSAAFSAVTALLVTLLLLQQFCKPTSRFYFIDNPNERSLHTNPTPRSGGLAIIFGSVIALLFGLWDTQNFPDGMMWIGIASLIIAVLSYFDDRFGLPALYRFIGHVTAALLVVTHVAYLDSFTLPGKAFVLPGIVALPINVIFLIWMTNLYNFMDGMDGFAGGMTFFGFSTFALFAYFSHASELFTVCIIIVMSSLSFLKFNFPPAKIFMGDTGSTTLGFIAGSFILLFNRQTIMPAWIGIMVFSPFIVDATLTLLQRAVKLEKIWHAHRTHYYQRLVRLGWGHKKTVLIEYFLMLLSSVLAIIALKTSLFAQWVIIIVLTMVYVAFFISITRMETKMHDTNRP